MRPFAKPFFAKSIPNLLLGECWSGPDDEIQYNKIGRDDNKCLTRNYQTCAADPNANNMECIGTQKANYVYGIAKTQGKFGF